MRSFACWRILTDRYVPAILRRAKRPVLSLLDAAHGAFWLAW